MRLVCPRCRQPPHQMVVLRSGIPVCGRCGEPLNLVRPIGLVPALGALAIGAALAVAVVPQSSRVPGPAAAEPSFSARFRESTRPPVPESAEPLVQPTWLLSELEQADRQWIPRSEDLPDGRVRYHYKRRAGEPELDLEQIRALIADPPSYTRERQWIASLLASLRRAGVRVSLSEPRKQGAAGEWDPARRSLRIQPRVVAKGSLDFARVLNHEAIHVAQSCRAGGVARPPRPLGLPTAMDSELESHLAEPVYAQASVLERELEREAYANQHNLELGLALLRAQCRLG